MLKLDGVQPIWEKSFIDEAKTNADFFVCEPRKEAGELFLADKPWETTMHYINMIRDKDRYRMYYITHAVLLSAEFNVDENGNRKAQGAVYDTFVCYAESKDGLHWEKPALGICEFDGNKDTNILFRTRDLTLPADQYGNFFVFIDDNPNCRKGERYKAMVERSGDWRQHLTGYVSDDGIHFEYKYKFDMKGTFDTLNTCMFDKNIGKYVAYIRDFHKDERYKDIHGVRDVRRSESEDWISWSVPERWDLKGSEEYPLYTNNVMQYYRNPNIYLAFPTRYVERQEWTKNYDELCGIESRKKRIEVEGETRAGLSITDCIFMASRDGKAWDKYDEALFAPGPEAPYNWVYGDGYPAYFILETFSEERNRKEMSMFLSKPNPDLEKGERAGLYRYTFRLDGFACYRAPYNGASVATKPFVFDGEELYINFSTSARGYVIVKIEAEDGTSATTCELFGDTDRRRVVFEDGKIADFAGKQVTLTFEMRDAKLYSFEVSK